MKLLVIVLITLIVAVSVALWTIENPGYVLIAVGSWTAETTLALAVIVVLLTFVAAYYSIRMIVRMHGVPSGIRHWRRHRRELKAMKSLTRGLIDLAEGRWQRSEKQLLKYANDGYAPLLNYLGAARAAQGLGEDQRRDKYLKLAHESYPDADIAVGLTQAELQLQHYQLEQALATLRHLQQLAPKHQQVLKVLARLYEDLGDWEHLLEIIPQLRKGKIYSGDEIDRLNIVAYLALINSYSDANNDESIKKTKGETNIAESLKSLWNRIPSKYQENEKILLSYVRRLTEIGETTQLEPILRMALKRRRNNSLIYYYGLVKSTDSNRHLAMAESLLIGHERDAVTLLTVGRLSIRNQLWGKARSYLEASVHSKPSAEAYNELGNLLDRLGEKDLAADCFREGLRLAPGCEFSESIGTDGMMEHMASNPGDMAFHESDASKLPSLEEEKTDIAEIKNQAKKVMT